MKQRGATKYGVITFLLVLLILLMAGLLVVMLYGDRIRSRFNLNDGKLQFTGAEGSGYVSSETVGTGSDGAEAGGVGSDGAAEAGIGSDGAAENGGAPEETEAPPVEAVPEEPALPDYETAAGRPDGLTIYSGSRKVEDFTVRTAGSVTKLRADGGSGVYAWASRNPEIAAVDQGGNVTAVSNGTTKIVVTDGSVKKICTVRIYTGSGNSEGSAHQLNRSDFTRKVSEGPYQLNVEGITEGISWRSTNPNVATVSNIGLVTPIGRGTCDIIASWEDQSRVCTIRVPKE